MDIQEYHGYPWICLVNGHRYSHTVTEIEDGHWNTIHGYPRMSMHIHGEGPWIFVNDMNNIHGCTQRKDFINA